MLKEGVIAVGAMAAGIYLYKEGYLDPIIGWAKGVSSSSEAQSENSVFAVDGERDKLSSLNYEPTEEYQVSTFMKRKGSKERNYF